MPAQRCLRLPLFLLAALSHVLASPSTLLSSQRVRESIVAGAINVHLIPHSHDDVGWTKSPSQYAFGQADIGILPSLHYADGSVNRILDTVSSALLRNKNRTFVSVEQFFFRKWFSRLDADTQESVRGLAASGQLQFANGGLCMHDESGPTVVDMLDQTEAGLRNLLEQIGPFAAPRVTSQIDPFGHSATQASLFSSPLAGYSAIYMARLDYEEAAARAANKTPDFVWQASPSLGEEALTLGIFGVQDGYGPPDGLCFDASIECFPFTDPINDDEDPDAEDNNVAFYVNLTVTAARRYATTYPTASDGTIHVPFMMGSDFQWSNAFMNFASLDLLVKYVNVNTSTHNVAVFYSSPADYAAARLSTDAPLTLRTGDAFPYADSPHSVWSGYFTSRPGLKGYIRDTSALFQAAKQLQAFAKAAPDGPNSPSNPLWLLETAMGIAQHHDAVAGTSKQAVAFDYARRLASGRLAGDNTVNSLLSTFIGGAADPSLVWASCDLANATICPSLEAAAVNGQSVALVIYNAQSHVRDAVPLRIPVGIIPSLGVTSWAVLGPDGATPLTAQLLPASEEDIAALRETYYGNPAGPSGAPSDGTLEWLAFQVPSISALGYAIVFLSPSKGEVEHTHRSRVERVVLGTSSPTISNGIVTLTFDSSSGLLFSFSSPNVRGGASLPINQSLLFYTASSGDAASGQASGAYIFRVADNTTVTPIEAASGNTVNLTLITGPVVNEARQTFSSWASQVVRLWANSSASFQIEWTVGPIPVDDLLGKEVISRVVVGGWNTAATWASDSNGREMQTRVRNQRPQYPLTVTEFAAQNYAPVNTAIRMTEVVNGTSLLILTDRTQGGGSLSDGSVELMLHRRLLWDDSRGVLEALNEPGVNGLGLIARGAHTYVFADAAQVASAHKAALGTALWGTVWRAGVLPTGTTPASWVAGRRTTFSGLAVGVTVPQQLSLISIHAWNSTSLLVRVAHMFEVGEDPLLSKNASLDLAGIFDPSLVKVTAAVEMALGGNQRLADVPSVTYKYVAQSQEEARKRMAGGDPRVKVWPGNGKGEEVLYEQVTLPVVPPAPAGPGLTVILAPMQIRTFMLTVA